MYVYRNSKETYSHKVFSSGSLSDVDGDVEYSYVAPDDQEYSGIASNVEIGVYEIPIEPSSYDGEVNMEVSYTLNGTNITEEVPIIFAPPYVPVETLNNVFPDLDYPEKQKKERIVANIIDAYCGQSFGTYKRTIHLNGSGGDSLHLPLRMLSLDKLVVMGEDITDYAEVSNTHWSLKRKSEIETTPFYESHDLFKQGKTYEITGDFGWNIIPPQIREAAEMIIRDYEEPEAKWRESNVQSLSAADWSVEFASRPITTTGNVNADILISRFVVPRWAVI